mmetsp:Transcript_8800/g.28810  ORF Transcript_8800/g.28810 Transcript_8800/m.28810 type:complete len:232 (-) Transcript_8800:127-822(-)
MGPLHRCSRLRGGQPRRRVRTAGGASGGGAAARQRGAPDARRQLGLAGAVSAAAAGALRLGAPSPQAPRGAAAAARLPRAQDVADWFRGGVSGPRAHSAPRLAVGREGPREVQALLDAPRRRGRVGRRQVQARGRAAHARGSGLLASRVRQSWHVRRHLAVRSAAAGRCARCRAVSGRRAARRNVRRGRRRRDGARCDGELRGGPGFRREGGGGHESGPGGRRGVPEVLLP